MENRILGTVALHLEELQAEYEAAIPTLQRAVAELVGIRRGLSANSLTPPRPEAQGTPASVTPDRHSPGVELDVRSADLGQMLELQEVLANVSGVSRVTVIGVGAGKARLLVEMNDRAASTDETFVSTEPTLVCAVCRKVLTEGGPQISHGLCGDCAEPFVAGARREGSGALSD